MMPILEKRMLRLSYLRIMQHHSLGLACAVHVARRREGRGPGVLSEHFSGITRCYHEGGPWTPVVTTIRPMRASPRSAQIYNTGPALAHQFSLNSSAKHSTLVNMKFLVIIETQLSFAPSLKASILIFTLLSPGSRRLCRPELCPDPGHPPQRRRGAR